MDASTRLAQIDAAITAILAGGVSSYSIGSRAATKLDLPALFAQRDKLAWEVERQNGGSVRNAKLMRPSR